ncbi:MAG: MgtC/SapB family protein [Chitinivibrionales bacterium]
MNDLPFFDWQEIGSNLYHMVVAYALAFPIGWERETRARSAGIRTFPLVSVAACGYLLTGISVLESSEAYARVIYGLMTGIGFIGGGAIIKSGGSVTGTATAASIWSTGAIGMAVAFDRWEIAILLSTLNYVTLRFVRIIKIKIGAHDTESHKE